MTENKHPLAGRKVIFPEEELLKVEQSFAEIAAGKGCAPTGKMPHPDFEPVKKMYWKNGKFVGIVDIGEQDVD